MSEFVYKTVKGLGLQLKEKKISTHAAGAAFFFFLSLAPMLAALCAILPYTPLTPGGLIVSLQKFVPEGMYPFVGYFVGEVYEKSRGILSFAALGAFWSAGKGVMALMLGLNTVGDREEGRNYFVVRLISSFYTLLFLLAMIVALFFMAFGRGVADWLIQSLRLQMWKEVLFLFRGCLMVLLLAGLLVIVYTYVPSGKLPLKRQIPGALFAATIWCVYSWGFSLYMDFALGHSVYGSLSILILMMLWLYFGIYIVLVGALLNHKRIAEMLAKGGIL